MMLDGKSAVVTGAGAGIGRASSLRFAGEGSSVICADISLDRVNETVRMVQEAGGVAFAAVCDVSDEDDVKNLVEIAAQRYGRLDIMFNNAGIPTPRLGLLMEEHTVEDFDRLVGVNLRGPWLGSKYAVQQFKRQGGGGVVLNTGSVAGLVGWGGAVYGAIKGGVHQLTRAVAIEGAPFGIRCNALCPGGLPYTQFLAAGGREVRADQLEALGEQTGKVHPLGKPILAEDVADAATFLVSDRANNITGVLLPIDGGYVAR